MQDTTVITMTIPYTPSLSKSGTLRIERGGRSQEFQFHYVNNIEMASAVGEALQVFADTAPVEEPEPVELIDLPVKYGAAAVPPHFIQIVGGESDAAAYRHALMVAARLIDADLWDGKTPIRFDDVYGAVKKLKYLSDRDLTLYDLSDFTAKGE